MALSPGMTDESRPVATDATPVPLRAARGRRRRQSTRFYATALDPADRAGLDDAAAVQGLDQEIALLRLRLRRLLSEHPDDHALAVRAMELLVRAVGAACRLTPAESDDVLARVSAELGGVLSLIAEAEQPDA